jgi:twitching motility protein PilT
MIDLNSILTEAISKNASDVHLKAGRLPGFRIDGELVDAKQFSVLGADELTRLAESIMTEKQKDRFSRMNEIDIAFGSPSLGRFRVNIFQQSGKTGMVLRVIPYAIASFKELFLPKILKEISQYDRGLILATGATGCGKSTTLAAMLDHINANFAHHIVTIEEPIEYLIKDKKSIVNQREVGSDTSSFHEALRTALRQDPDVIFVGEMRDAETMEIALSAAETGHLVFSTLHTTDAVESINRIVSSFPSHHHRQIRIQLGSVLRAVISQRLIPRKTGGGRVPALEILVNNSRVREMIENPEKTKEIHGAIAESFDSYGMRSFDQSLMELITADLISYEEALRQSTNSHDFALRYSGISSGNDRNWDPFESMMIAKDEKASSSD